MVTATPPSPGAEQEGPALDSAQRRIAAAVSGGGHHAVHGAPGSGKTQLALALTVDEARRGRRPILLVPTRRRAAALRHIVTRRIGRTLDSAVVRTPAALAFSILRLRASHRGEVAPTLIAGPEQDQILAELLAGHAQGEGSAVTWPAGIGPQTWQLPAFRHELRDVLMRAAEAGLTGPELTAWGEHHQRPEWIGAGQVLTEYTAILALGQLTPDRGARYDAASIVDEAVSALRQWESDVPGTKRPAWTLVVHDEYQDATLATARLLTELAGDGAALSVIGDADSAVQSFRGGVPALLATASRPAGDDGAWGATEHTLQTVHRHPPGLRDPIRRLTQRLPVLAAGGRRDAASATSGIDDAPAHDPLHLAVLGSAAQEVAYVAYQLRSARLLQQVPWSSMAVIARSSGQLGAIRRGLRAAGVPLDLATPDRPLRDEPAVRPLLAVLRAVIEGAVDLPTALTLLTSPIGGMDSVSLRSLRRQLRAAERTAGGQRSSAQLLPELLWDTDTEIEVPVRHRRGVGAVARVLAAARHAMAEPEAGVETVLWAAWDATALAPSWQQQALRGGLGADRADADLDAVLALFQAAEQFVDRTPHSSPAAFVEHLNAQDFPADTLAARGQRTDAVAVHTAAGAAGEQWDVVAVVGVQEDVWPDLRIRDSVLGAADLADLTTGRHSPGTDASTRAQMARAEVADGELRSFVAAVSRARERLIVTAVLDDDQRPSVFLDLLSGTGTETHEVTDLPAPLDLRGLVGQLRSALRPVLAGAGRNGADLDGADLGAADLAVASEAAAVLSHLRAHGVPGADPQQWGMLHGPTSTGALFGESELPSVSPSSVEWLTKCPLRWVLTRNGGDTAASHAQTLGNLIHEIAAAYPDGDELGMRQLLAQRWPELGLEEGWAADSERERAERMIGNLATYCASRRGRVEVERAFDVEVSGVRMRGRVDRLEYTDDGVRVVDLKTGTTAVGADAATEHPQLGAYQVAVQAGGFDDQRSAGAALVYPGVGKTKPSIRTQPPLADAEDPQWAHTMLAEVGQVLASGTFEARRNPDCPRCPVRSSCPAYPDGARVAGTQR